MSRMLVSALATLLTVSAGRAVDLKPLWEIEPKVGELSACEVMPLARSASGMRLHFAVTDEFFQIDYRESPTSP